MNLAERRSNAENQALEITHKKLRVQRLELISRLAQAERSLRVIFNPVADDLADWVSTHASPTGIPGINERIRQRMIELRRSLNAWLLTMIRDTTKMSLRHAGNALLPIFQSNQEMVRLVNVGMILTEARLTFDLSTKFANRTDPRVKLSSDKWKGKQNLVIQTVTKKSIKGLRPSDLIWDLTRKTESDLRRLVVSGVAQGEHPSVIARKVKKYVSPARTDYGTLERGVYRSPFKNAMRLARTEATKAYNHATAEFAADKSWVKGIQVKLGPAHDVPDECDAWDGKIIEPEEFADTFPLHPHCMCMGVYVIDPKFLGKE